MQLLDDYLFSYETLIREGSSLFVVLRTNQQSVVFILGTLSQFCLHGEPSSTRAGHYSAFGVPVLLNGI